MNATTMTERSSIRDARFQAYTLLRTGFAVAPILFGLDKFFDVLVEWPRYLAPWVNDVAPGSAQDFMYVVGGVEILAGLLVAVKPRYGAYLVAAWLGGIIVNLLSRSGYYDIALRDGVGRMNRLRRLRAAGVSIWLDTLSRELLESGRFERHVREHAVTGVTANPTILERALAGSSAYDAQLDRLADLRTSPKAAFFELALDDVR